MARIVNAMVMLFKKIFTPPPPFSQSSKKITPDAPHPKMKSPLPQIAIFFLKQRLHLKYLLGSVYIEYNVLQKNSDECKTMAKI